MFGAIAGGIASALAGGAMSKLFGGGQKAASGGIQGDVLATDNNTVGMGDAGIKSAIQGSNVPNPDERSEERRVGKECRSRRSPYHYTKNQRGGKSGIEPDTNQHRLIRDQDRCCLGYIC